MNYVSIDIETTGLVHESPQILEIAAIYVEGGKEKSVWEQVIDPREVSYCGGPPGLISGSPFALHLNRNLLQKISVGSAIHIDDARQKFKRWLVELPFKNKITVAGKNFAGFDRPILEKYNLLPDDLVSHRVLDPGNMWAPYFGYNPSLSELNSFLGLPPVTHRAVDDARNVVAAIEEARKRFGRKQEAA